MSYKPTLHKYIVRLYEDDDLEADIVDYVSNHTASRRQELLRSFIKVGFSMLVTKTKRSRSPYNPSALDRANGDTKDKKRNKPKKRSSVQQVSEQERSAKVIKDTPDVFVDPDVEEAFNEDIDNLPSLPISNKDSEEEYYAGHTQDEMDELDPLARMRSKFNE